MALMPTIPSQSALTPFGPPLQFHRIKHQSPLVIPPLSPSHSLRPQQISLNQMSRFLEEPSPASPDLEPPTQPPSRQQPTAQPMEWSLLIVASSQIPRTTATLMALMPTILSPSTLTQSNPGSQDPTEMQAIQRVAPQLLKAIRAFTRWLLTEACHGASVVEPTKISLQLMPVLVNWNSSAAPIMRRLEIVAATTAIWLLWRQPIPATPIAPAKPSPSMSRMWMSLTQPSMMAMQLPIPWLKMHQAVPLQVSQPRELMAMPTPPSPTPSPLVAIPAISLPSTLRRVLSLSIPLLTTNLIPRMKSELTPHQLIPIAIARLSRRHSQSTSPISMI